MWFGVPVFKWA
uniref:Uncharacterized protein n=1 Tax=Anguilla anguilla TaxID=7936 RepID=A0A0E9UJE0_ANGAN